MADTRKISVTEGLKELKLYDARINKAIETTQFIGSKKKSSDKVGVFKTENFVDNARAGYQSICDLINNRNALKAAIVQSNAETVVEVAGKNYTVAQAIERKNTIIYDKYLLDNMKAQYSKAVNTVTKENNKVDAQVDKMLEAFVGKDSEKKINENDFSAISDPYKAKNEWELVDPLELYYKIESLEKEILEFEADVDVRLSVSNSITYIEI